MPKSHILGWQILLPFIYYLKFRDEKTGAHRGSTVNKRGEVFGREILNLIQLDSSGWGSQPHPATVAEIGRVGMELGGWGPRCGGLPRYTHVTLPLETAKEAATHVASSLKFELCGCGQVFPFLWVLISPVKLGSDFCWAFWKWGPRVEARQLAKQAWGVCWHSHLCPLVWNPLT